MLSFLKSVVKEEALEAESEPSLAAAALMFEVAWADHEIDEDELERMRAGLTRLFKLEAEQINTLLEESKSLHQQSVGLHEFTREINAEFDDAQKYMIIESLWRIALADDEVAAIEEHMIRRIADLIYVPHRLFIAAKRSARET